MNMRFDEARAGGFITDVERESELYPITADPDPAAAIQVAYDKRDLRPSGTDDVTYQLTDARLDTKTFFTAYGTALKNHLLRTQSVELFANTSLNVFSRPGETIDDFTARCEAAADDRADEESAKLRDKYETRVDRAKLALVKAEDRLRELSDVQAAKKRDELLSGAGSLLSALLGGKKRGLGGRLARSLGSAGQRRGRTNQTGERIRSAQNRVEETGSKIYELELALDSGLTEVDQKRRTAATAVETRDIGLEKADITIDEVVLAWLPL